MVTLVIWDFDEHSALEDALCRANIEYQLSFDVFNYGIKVPYLIVDGVPLDYQRAMKWIKEQSNE